MDKLRGLVDRLRRREVYVPDPSNVFSLCDAIAGEIEALLPSAECPDLTDISRDALCWILWHHQGGNSKIGQAVRFSLGMGQHERMSDAQVAAAKRWDPVSAECPEGFVMVPLMLTGAMADALKRRFGSLDESPQSTWTAMLAAAPSPPSTKEG